MAQVTEAEILKRAKELCAANGTAWDVQLTVQPKYTKLVPAIDEAGRKKYLAEATKQLSQELGE